METERDKKEKKGTGKLAAGNPERKVYVTT